MKSPWFNTDFVDDTTDISFILPEYYPKWNVDVDSMCKTSVIHQTNLDIKNEYSRGPLFKFLTEGSLQNTTCSKENKDMNHKIKYAKNDKIKNMLDSWTSEPRIKTIIPKMIKHNGPATIVFWADGTKTVVKCQEGDAFDPNTGLAHAISKKALGDSYKKEFKKWTGKYNITRPLVLTDEVLEKLRANLLARLKGE